MTGEVLFSVEDESLTSLSTIEAEVFKDGERDARDSKETKKPLEESSLLAVLRQKEGAASQSGTTDDDAKQEGARTHPCISLARTDSALARTKGPATDTTESVPIPVALFRHYSKSSPPIEPSATDGDNTAMTGEVLFSAENESLTSLSTVEADVVKGRAGDARDSKETKKPPEESAVLTPTLHLRFRHGGARLRLGGKAAEGARERDRTPEASSEQSVPLAAADRLERWSPRVRSGISRSSQDATDERTPAVTRQQTPNRGKAVSRTTASRAESPENRRSAVSSPPTAKRARTRVNRIRHDRVELAVFHSHLAPLLRGHGYAIRQGGVDAAGRRENALFMPPGVAPCAPYKPRVDFFHTYSMFIEYLRSRGDAGGDVEVGESDGELVVVRHVLAFVDVLRVVLATEKQAGSKPDTFVDDVVRVVDMKLKKGSNYDDASRGGGFDSDGARVCRPREHARAKITLKKRRAPALADEQKQQKRPRRRVDSQCEVSHREREAVSLCAKAVLSAGAAAPTPATASSVSETRRADLTTHGARRPSRQRRQQPRALFGLAGCEALDAIFVGASPYFSTCSEGGTSHSFDWDQFLWASGAKRCTAGATASSSSSRFGLGKRQSVSKEELERACLFLRSSFKGGMHTDVLSSSARSQRMGLLFLSVAGELRSVVACLSAGWGVEILFVGTSPDFRRNGYGRLAIALLLAALEQLWVPPEDSVPTRRENRVMFRGLLDVSGFYESMRFKFGSAADSAYVMEGTTDSDPNLLLFYKALPRTSNLAITSMTKKFINTALRQIDKKARKGTVRKI
uniref:N-acetyltransferase domain-containing protein n=1 Tax=Odontella aurita TaxID=265563 RepID=A0A7S4NHQ5_9STRA